MNIQIEGTGNCEYSSSSPNDYEDDQQMKNEDEGEKLGF